MHMRLCMPIGTLALTHKKKIKMYSFCEILCKHEKKQLQT